jgi:hypothetical protein
MATKKKDTREYGPAPGDEQLLKCWRAGMDTEQIARRYHYPEYCVASRLWRLREGHNVIQWTHQCP